MEENEPLKIVLIGNAVDGFEAHGPFSSDGLLDDFMNDMGEVHAIMELIIPPNWTLPLPPAQDEDDEGEE